MKKWVTSVLIACDIWIIIILYLVQGLFLSFMILGYGIAGILTPEIIPRFRSMVDKMKGVL